MKTVTAIANQTVWDISLQEMGDASGAFEIMGINAFIRPDMALSVGQPVLVPDTVINASVVDYYTRNNSKPVSGLGEAIELTITDMINVTQNIAYDFSDGNEQFAGVRLSNMGDELSLQLNYTDLTGDVIVYVEQSLDGINYSPISGAFYELDPSEDSHTFNFVDLVTNFCRVRLEAAGGATGTLDTITWRT